MKIFNAIVLFVFCSFGVSAQTDTIPEIKRPDKKIERLREDPQTPKHIDKDVTHSDKDRMPVLRKADNGRMPVKKEVSQDRMPVKQIPDSTSK